MCGMIDAITLVLQLQYLLSPFIFKNGQVFSVHGIERELCDLISSRREVRMVELFLKVLGILAKDHQVALPCVVGRMIHAEKSSAQFLYLQRHSAKVFPAMDAKDRKGRRMLPLIFTDECRDKAAKLSYLPIACNTLSAAVTP